jgi:2-dehydropantoate 2-reductase
VKRICIVGAGAIGSLYAAHLSRVAEVWALVRRPEHAASLRDQGLRVSGTRQFAAKFHATASAADVPECDFAIVATKAMQAEEAFAPVGAKIRTAVLSAQNGLGSEEALARHTRAFVVRGATFMSGTRHSDTHVQFELDTPTWMGPFEPTRTPFEVVRELADLVRAGGLRAEALEDARPAQWAKLVFNASVNSVAALTELPHCPAFADEKEFGSLGHLLHELIDEGVRVAAALGIDLREDPWRMNCVGAQTNHPPSMLADVRAHSPTEIDFLGGAIAREAARAGVAAPLHTALYRLIRGKELSWTFADENVAHGERSPEAAQWETNQAVTIRK